MIADFTPESTTSKTVRSDAVRRSKSSHAAADTSQGDGDVMEE